MRVILKYPVRAALNPFASTLAYLFPYLVSGSIIVSLVLSLPTVGPVLLKRFDRPGHVSGGHHRAAARSLDRGRHLHLRSGAHVDRSAHPPPGGPMSAVRAYSAACSGASRVERTRRRRSHCGRHAAAADLVAVQEAQAGRREPVRRGAVLSRGRVRRFPRLR